MSLTARVPGTLQKIANLLENKHMNDTNHHQTSTPDAENTGELRTQCGPEATGKVHKSIQFSSRDAAIESLCKVVFGGSPVYPDPVPQLVQIDKDGIVRPVPWDGTDQAAPALPEVADVSGLREALDAAIDCAEDTGRYILGRVKDALNDADRSYALEKIESATTEMMGQLEHWKKKADQPAPALPDASRLRINRGEQALSEAMQDVWNDRCIDIGEVPTCFEIHGPKTTRITADFIDSAFVRDIVETMNARGYTIQPAPAPSDAVKGFIDHMLDSVREWQKAVAEAVRGETAPAPSETITVGRSVGKSWVGPAPSEPCDMRHCPACKPKATSATPDECDDLATLQRVERELAEAREQRDRLAACLNRLRDDFVLFRDLSKTQGIGGTLGLQAIENADAALAAVKAEPAAKILGMTATVDPSLPPGTAVLRDPKTGEILQTIKVKE